MPIPADQPHSPLAPGPASPTSPSAALLSVTDVLVRFGGITALDGVSFDLAPGKICGLIGPNGAGKTTLLNCLSRIYPCERGDIVFAGRSVLGLSRHQIAPLGIGRTFQNLALFKTMSVSENILVGRHCRTHSGFFANAVRLPGVERERRAAVSHTDELLRFLDLDAVRDARVSDLPFGTQKRVELARALANDPKLLLLDEPACGLNHEEVGALGRVIRDIRQKLGVTVLLIEHHMHLIMEVSDQIVVLNFGRKIAEGTPAEIRRNPEVIQAYLGDFAA
ncbi:MAG: ABC transporter ATP-binding protein [Opitutus sp.]|nr:ABC transporter ATP-binding protein [Opitutus sp.]